LRKIKKSDGGDWPRARAHIIGCASWRSHRCAAVSLVRARGRPLRRRFDCAGRRGRGYPIKICGMTRDQLKNVLRKAEMRGQFRGVASFRELQKPLPPL